MIAIKRHISIEAARAVKVTLSVIAKEAIKEEKLK